MIKRSVLSMVAGGTLAAVLLFVPATAAYCMGYCEELDGYDYVGCSIHLDSRGRPDVVICGYIESPKQEANNY